MTCLTPEKSLPHNEIVCDVFRLSICSKNPLNTRTHLDTPNMPHWNTFLPELFQRIPLIHVRKTADFTYGNLWLHISKMSFPFFDFFSQNPVISRTENSWLHLWKVVITRIKNIFFSFFFIYSQHPVKSRTYNTRKHVRKTRFQTQVIISHAVNTYRNTILVHRIQWIHVRKVLNTHTENP